MNRTRNTASWIGALLMAPALAQAQPVRTPHMTAQLFSEHAALTPGRNTFGLQLAPEKGWHVYWRNPGDSGLATSLRWTLPAGFAAGAMQWPLPEMVRFGPLMNYGYPEPVLHLVDVQVPAGAAGHPARIGAEARWLVCADICVPGKAAFTLELPVLAVGARAPVDAVHAPEFAAARAALPQAGTLPGEYQIADGQIRLHLRLPGNASEAPAEFFPFDNLLVNHAAPQTQARADGTLTLAQKLNDSFTEAPARVAGLLVLRGTPARGYEVALQPGTVPAVAAPPAPARTPLLAALGLALLGGLILNLMPCVFPVLSIKAVSLLEARGAAAGHGRAHALAYTAGVIGSCLTAAIAILALRAGGQALGWGFQLQSPAFVAALAYVLFALGLSMSGLVNFGTALMGVGQSLTVREGWTGSFFTGVLAVIVASPCTAPFMGTALGFALTQPPALALLVFAALGLGLALPFLLIGFVPAAGAWLPRPGAWMETFKQAMAFPMYFTVIWLVWVLGRQAGLDAVALILAGLVLIAAACWLLRHAGLTARALRYAALLAAVALLFQPAVRTHAATAPSAASAAAGEWQPWSEARVAELRGQGHAVFVDFTADWCLSCKVNERVALNTDEVRGAFAAHGVALLRGDWTNTDPAITSVLQRFNQPGVPLYLLYAPAGEPQVLPQLLTPATVIEALDHLAS